MGDSEWKLQCNFSICLGVENKTTMQRGRTSLAINGMPPWTSSEQMPGLTAYESMLHRKGITPSTMMNTGSMEAFRL